MSDVLERYESRGGKYWVQLERDAYGLSARYSNGCACGIAEADFRARLARGDFQADANTSPMRRTT